jgi:hypothetical protein
MENENGMARVRESVTSRSTRGGVRVEALQHEVETDGETVVLQSVKVSVRRGDEEHFAASLTVGEATCLFEALADLFEGRAEPVFDERERGGFAGAQLAVEREESAENEVDGLPVRPGLVLKVDDWGSVEGLEDEELADLFELERCAVRDYWPWWLVKLCGRQGPGEPWFPN